MKLSVITITWNAAKYLERTIESVLALRDVDLEYLLIDGGSTDGTMDIVERYRSSFATVLSERDAGISDAWNKGIARATGDVIALLNAGDEHQVDTAALALAAIARGADVTYGDTDLVAEDGSIVSRHPGRFHPWKYSGGIGFYHPTCFAKAALYKQIGVFDLKLKYAMDTDWILRAWSKGARIEYVPATTRMLDDGVSVVNRFLAYGEYLHCLTKHTGSDRAALLSMLATSARGLGKRALGRGSS